MISHIIVFVVLAILSAIAAHAVGQPISKSPEAQHAPGTEIDSTKQND